MGLWVSHGHHMSVTWVVTWVSLGCHMGVTWLSHRFHLENKGIVLKRAWFVRPDINTLCA